MNDVSNKSEENINKSYLTLDYDGEICWDFATKGERKILKEALKRVTIIKVGDEYQIKEKTASEINVASNIFNWLLHGVKNTNLIRNVYVSTRIETADDSMSSSENYCVPYCIEYIARTYLGDSLMNVEEMKEYQRQLCSKEGVTAKKFCQYVTKYLVGYSINKNCFPSSFESSKNNAMMGVMNYSEQSGIKGMAHAVSITFIEGENAHYYDPMSDTEGDIPVNDLMFGFGAFNVVGKD